jgi:hypothetical protein
VKFVSRSIGVSPAMLTFIVVSSCLVGAEAGLVLYAWAGFSPMRLA